MPNGYGNPFLKEVAQVSLKILTRRDLAPAMGNAVLTRQNISSRLKLAVLLATGACLSACAGGPPFGVQQASPSAPVETMSAAAEPAPIAVAPLDPINAPAPGPLPATDPLLVPAPSAPTPGANGSQRVALGALAAMPAAGAPTSIMQPPAAKQATPAPAVAAPAPAPAPMPAPVQQAAAEPPPAAVTLTAPAPVQVQAEPPAAAPRLRSETVRTSVMSTPQVIQVPAPEARPLGSAPVLRPPQARAGASRPSVQSRDELQAETVIISSQSAPAV